MRELHIYANMLNNEWLYGRGAFYNGVLELPVGSTTLVVVHAVNKPFIVIESDFSVKTADQFPLTDLVASGVMPFKTETGFFAGADAVATFTGFAHSGYYSPGTGVVDFYVTPLVADFAPDDYAAEVVLYNAGGQRDVIGGTLWPTITQSTILTTTTPSGGSSGQVKYPFTIANSNSTAVVTIPGLTAAGAVNLVMTPSTGGCGNAVPTVDLSVAGQVTVDAGVAPGTGGAYNGYLVLVSLK